MRASSIAPASTFEHRRHAGQHFLLDAGAVLFTGPW
jgi:hypothetical protein